MTAVTLGVWGASIPVPEEAAIDAPAARIQPDYRDLIIPPNIAPLNFLIQESGVAYRVRLRPSVGPPLELASNQPKMRFPEKEWRELLGRNTGEALRTDVWVKGVDARWKRFQTMTNRVSNEAIDPVLIYRRIHPAHNSWHSMGLYQRQLQTFDETPILENRRFDHDCCHCHALRNNNPNQATILIRSRTFKNSLLVISNKTAEAIQGSVGFTAWHPTGSVAASAFSKPHLLLHSAKKNDMRDIAESESWIGYFQMGSGIVKKIPPSDASHLLGFPTWSPDGAYLYYCSAPNPLTNSTNTLNNTYAGIKYDLMRIAYNIAQDQWGEPEMVLSARRLGLSVAQPRISPNGRWLFFCGTAYGCWPTYDPDSDLYAIDLSAAKNAGESVWRKLELNSPECESWLSWSANSRWVVFSSKRQSPLFNRPYLAYVSADGQCGKPFVLPQGDPTSYEFQLDTFTIPTLATGPVTVPQMDLVQAIKAKKSRTLVMP